MPGLLSLTRLEFLILLRFGYLGLRRRLFVHLADLHRLELSLIRISTMIMSPVRESPPWIDRVQPGRDSMLS